MGPPIPKSGVLAVRPDGWRSLPATSRGVEGCEAVAQVEVSLHGRRSAQIAGVSGDEMWRCAWLLALP